MRALCLAVLVFATLTGASGAQSSSEALPAACARDATGAVNYQACADAASPGSAARSWALINLGTQAYLAQDYAGAVRLYDQAEPTTGNHIYSDAGFHAYRADAYQRVGRTQEALTNAQTAWAILSHSPSVSPAILAQADSTPIDIEMVYGLILPILKDAHDASYETALAAYNALPAVDWMSYANRAVVLEELGDHAGALRANTQVLAAQPDQPQVLNTQCAVLAELGRGSEALPYCVRAVALAPDVAAVHDSYAAALAVSGQCSQANHERDEAHRLDPATQDYTRPPVCSAGSSPRR